MATVTNETKDTATVTNINLAGGDRTWDETTTTWDNTGGTWDRATTGLTNQAKN